MKGAEKILSEMVRVVELEVKETIEKSNQTNHWEPVERELIHHIIKDIRKDACGLANLNTKQRATIDLGSSHTFSSTPASTSSSNCLTTACIISWSFFNVYVIEFFNVYFRLVMEN